MDKSEIVANVSREKVAKATIRNLYDSLIVRFPELEKEKEIRVAVKYGAVHTSLYRQAKRAGFTSVEREIQTPLYYFPSEAYIRRGTFKRNKWKLNKVTGSSEKTNAIWPSVKNKDEDIARTFMGDQLALHAHLNLGVNRSNSGAFGNLASRGISLTKFRRISSRLAKTKPTTSEEQGTFLVDALRKEGIKVPQTKEEIHSFLEKRRIPLARV